MAIQRANEPFGNYIKKESVEVLEQENSQKEINFQFKAEPSNFGYQVLAFKNDSFDIIIRNSDKRNTKKYKVQITEI